MMIANSLGMAIGVILVGHVLETHMLRKKVEAGQEKSQNKK